MSLARMHPRLCASAILLVGLVVGFVVHWTFANEHSGPLNTAQVDAHGSMLSSPPTSSPASVGACHVEATPIANQLAGSDAEKGCCKGKPRMEVATPVVTDVRATEQSPEEKTGLSIGQIAPAFTLIDQNGREVSLESLLKKGPVAVVFHRSVDWCLYCRLQMTQMQGIYKEIEAVGGQVVGISYDAPEKIEPFAKRNKITFPLLSDIGSKTIDSYGIRSTDAPSEKSGFARHATFIIDQKGVIRAKLFRLSYRERPAVESLINALQEARKVTGDAQR